MVYVHGVAVTSALGKPLIDRRKASVPVQQERRRINTGQPLGQH